MERQQLPSRRTGMRRRSAWLPALASLLVLVGCSAENDDAARANSSVPPSDTVPEVEQSATTEPVGPSLGCPTTRTSASVLEFYPPTPHAGLPHKPLNAKQAATWVLQSGAVLVRRVSLAEGVRVTHDGRETVRFAAVNARGTNVAVIAVQRRVGEAWSRVNVEQCAYQL